MSHLTAAQRGNIETLLQEKYTNKQIGEKLGKHSTTIGREITKGLDGAGIYRPFVAQAAYEANRKRSKQIPILDHPANHRLRSAVVACIERGWDPAMAAGRIHKDPERKDLPVFVCAETIYHWIYTSAFAVAEKLYQYLRYGKKRRTKQKGRSSQRSKIPNRVSIHDLAVNGFTAGTDGGVGPIKFVGTERYHPNALGHELLASAVRSQTNNFQAVMPVANPSLQTPAIPTTLGDNNLPKSGRPINTVVADNGLVPGILLKGQSTTVTADPTKATLKSAANYEVVMHSDPVELGTATTDARGSLAAITIQIPVLTSPGFHTIHIYGPDMLGQRLDITKTIYVAASADDFNGDSIPNTTDPCVFLPASGQDVDKDGIDDACDGFVAAPPAPPTPGYRQISSSVTLTRNSIMITRSPP